MRRQGGRIDVTDPEPLPADYRLWGYPNVILPPTSPDSRRAAPSAVPFVKCVNLLADYKAPSPAYAGEGAS